MPVTAETWEDALLLVASVRSALINGTKHYDKEGNLLTTEKEIMQALLNQKEIRFDVSNCLPVTTEEEQLALARREFQHRRGQYVQ